MDEIPERYARMIDETVRDRFRGFAEWLDTKALKARNYPPGTHEGEVRARVYDGVASEARGIASKIQEGLESV